MEKAKRYFPLFAFNITIGGKGFPYRVVARESMKASTTIQTPLGLIELTGAADADIEIRQGNLPVELPNGMVVDKAIAVILSIGAASSITNIVCSCRLQNDQLEGAPETGEYLDCITWETEE